MVSGGIFETGAKFHVRKSLLDFPCSFGQEKQQPRGCGYVPGGDGSSEKAALRITHLAGLSRWLTGDEPGGLPGCRRCKNIIGSDQVFDGHGDAMFPDQAGRSPSILSITGDAEDFSEAGLAFTDSFKS
jgi:hypothetical protein